MKKKGWDNNFCPLDRSRIKTNHDQWLLSLIAQACVHTGRHIVYYNMLSYCMQDLL